MSRQYAYFNARVVGHNAQAMIDTRIRVTVMHDRWISRLQGRPGVTFLPVSRIPMFLDGDTNVSAFALIKFVAQDGGNRITQRHPVIFLPYAPTDLVLGMDLLRLLQARIIGHQHMSQTTSETSQRTGFPIVQPQLKNGRNRV